MTNSLPIDDTMIFTNLDVSGGNSGGPLVNRVTGLVEGMPSSSSDADFVDFYQSGYSGPTCTGVATCGVVIDCPMYPSAYPIAEFASSIDAFIRGERPLLPTR